MQKVDKMCDAYRSRHLTLLGRTCIANVVICAQLWYVAAVIVLPDTIITEISRKIYAFIWTGRVEAVKRHTLTNHPAPTDPELSCTCCCQSSQIQSHHSHPPVSTLAKDK